MQGYTQRGGGVLPPPEKIKLAIFILLLIDKIIISISKI